MSYIDMVRSGGNPYFKYMSPEEQQMFQDQQNSAMWGEVGSRLMQAGGQGASTLEGLGYGAQGFNEGKQGFQDKFMKNKQLEQQVDALEQKRIDEQSRRAENETMQKALQQYLTGGAPASTPTAGFVEGLSPEATPAILDPGGSGSGTFEQGPMGLGGGRFSRQFEGPTMEAAKQQQMQAPQQGMDPMGGQAPGNFPQPLPAASSMQPQQGVTTPGYANTTPQFQGFLTPNVIMAMERLKPGAGIAVVMKMEEEKRQQIAAQQQAMQPFYEKVGDNLIQVDPRTGKATPVYSPEGSNLPDAPSGYRYADGGNLEAIPGGPATKLSVEGSSKKAQVDGALKSMKGIKEILGDADVLNPFTYSTRSGKTGRALRQAERAIEAYIRAISGAAVPDPEVVRSAYYYLPKPYETKETRQEKLNALEDFLTRSSTYMKQGREVPPILHMGESQPESLQGEQGITGGESIAAPTLNYNPETGDFE